MPQILRLSPKTKDTLIKLIDEYRNTKTNNEKDTIVTKTYYLLGQRTKKSTIKNFFNVHSIQAQ
jgi:hypothetical protein